MQTLISQEAALGLQVDFIGAQARGSEGHATNDLL
jgi:hypothetical protein